MRKVAKLLVIFLVSIMGLFVSSCEKNDEIKLNIIDDKYRNWYEVFVYSYYDTNNDGIGDLNGVTEKLDYIMEMGFNGIWLMPIHPSPTYHKYDVINYYEIDEIYGTLNDFKRLIDEAHKRGIKVILDLVINHTSSNHPWFKEACEYIVENGEVGGKYGQYYNFTLQGGTGFSNVNGSSYYYESRFWSGMPDLNLNSDEVKNEIIDIMEYWMIEYAVDGFRLDAVTSYYTGNENKNIAFLSWLNNEAKNIKDDCYIVGEAWLNSDNEINRYYESGIDSFFLFTGAQGTGTIANIVKQQSGVSLGKLMLDLQNSYEGKIVAPFLGNHDTMRPGSFMPGEEKVKMAAGILSMMNGSIFVYYGEEIGMISKDGLNSDPYKRIAMHWESESIYNGLCYMPPENIHVDETYYYYPSLEEQYDDKDSILNYYKKAMQLRNIFPSIARGVVEYYPSSENNYICVITKTYLNERITIVFNLDSFEQNVAFDLDELGASKIVGELYAASNSKAKLEDTTLKMPPYSIVILK